MKETLRAAGCLTVILVLIAGPTTTVADTGRATAAPVSPPRAAETPVDSSSAVQLVSSMIENAIELRATDIHLEPNKRGMIVRYRIDGQLQKILNIPPNMISAATSRVKVLSNMDVTELRICGLNETIKQIFEISGFDRILSVFASEQDALAGF